MACPNLNGQRCNVSSDLAALPVLAQAEACRVCTAASPPQAVNQVTVSLAVSAMPEMLGRALFAEHRELWSEDAARANAARLAAVVSGPGPGSQLWRLLESLGVRHTATCICLSSAERMNAWGVSGCRLARGEIVADMRTNGKAYGWGAVATAAGKAVLTGVVWWIDLADVYGSLVDEAIRRAESDGLSELPQA